MLILCIILVIAAAGFGSRETVNFFGYNLYVVQAEGFDKAPKGSAVIVKKVPIYSVEAGKLVLYEKGGDTEQYALGYVKEPHVVDGTYYLTVTDNVNVLEVPEVRVVGCADYSSVLVGSVIDFIKTPFGIFCIAIMPCLALILYDIIRAAAKSMPQPDVEPQIKNRRDEVVTQKNISIKGDGKAAYSKISPGKPNVDANDVLFNYSPKKREDRPIIPLTDKTSADPKPADPAQDDVKKRVNPGAIAGGAPRTPDAVGVSRYISNSRDGKGISDKTAELPDIGKARDQGDAFFAQTTSTSAVIPKDSAADSSSTLRAVGRQVPQIGRQSRTSEERDEPVITPRTAGKRSAQILASKRVEDLISDDDDGRIRKSDSVVDDIISGINKHDNF